ncbi:hypothetical protein G5B37_01205 [Rasiella rasia]|uniref:Uncharacterized protein n=1 Tax=Rasiella rasia TaxID=2744027 RepID=A0A6G6GKL1_9FLAO|nr:hypothetical protein [Rasiella rasia]QIE58231.1 hypothetical protein G5B37_01205 [Rasiella rasia]
MEQIKVIFFALASFFGIEDGRIAADATTVTINPQKKEIVIIQEDLFSVIQNEKDKAIALVQWDALLHYKELNMTWAKELASLESKTLIISPKKDIIQPRLTFTYTNEKDLRGLGIWYNAEKDEFSINHVPRYNLSTDNGHLSGNYWVFQGNKTFSFTLQPFLEMPEQYKNFKQPISELLLLSEKK